MVYNQEQEQTPAFTIQDNQPDDTEKEVAETITQHSEQEPSLPPSYPDSGNDNLDTTASGIAPVRQASTTSPPLQEELGRNFASRRIQVASLAIRSSHSASQSPLFVRHDMYRLYQQPFVASSLSPPALISTNTRTFSSVHHPLGESSSGSRSSLPSHLLSPSTLLDTNDRALFDKTWSVLAPKSESNQQQQLRKKARRRVTFNEHIQFFDPPPPMDYYDHPPTQVPTHGNKSVPTAATGSYGHDVRRQDEEKGDLVNDSGNSMSPPPPPLPQYSSYWANHYTNDTENPSPLSEPSKQLHQSSVSSTTSSSSSSSTSSSSSSSLSLSLSSSSTQTNSINNNSINIGPLNRSPPFFNQRFNASTSSLPAYSSSSSSNVYRVTPASGSTSSLASPTNNPSQIALQRKGNKISSHAILEILESRASNNKLHSAHHRRTTTKSNRSSFSPRPSQAPVGFDHTLDSVKQDIRQAIERAKASNTEGQQHPLSSLSSSLVAPPATETLSNDTLIVEPTEDSNTLTVDDSNTLTVEPSYTLPVDDSNTLTVDDSNTLTVEDSNTLTVEDSNILTVEDSNTLTVDDSNTLTVEDSNTLIVEDSNTLIVEDSNTDNQSSSEDDSSDSSATIPGGESDSKDDQTELFGDGNDSDKSISSPQDQDCDNVAFFGLDTCDSDASVANPTDDGEDHTPTVATNDPLVYLPSSDDQLSDFGDTLLNEFDRITGDLTHLTFSNSARREEHDRVQPIEESCNSDRAETYGGENTGSNILDISTGSSTPWRILGSQNDSPALNGNDTQPDQYRSSTTNGRLYVKIIAAENLDFPISPGAPSIQCSVNDGRHYLGSGHYKMQHNIHFNHEFILNDMAPDGEFTLTLHAIRPGEQTPTFTKRWAKRSSFTGKSDDLARYISQQDGALAQTRVSLKSVSYQCRTKLCTASFALVNGWYLPAKKSASHHPLFLSKAQRGKQNGPVQEKAVGKITLELFYLPNAHEQIPDLPADMDSCEDALNVQRFHQTVWLYGYMSQLGGDVKFWRRRYFKLIGGHLYSNTDTAHSPRTMIDLSKAVAIAFDNRVIMESKIHHKTHGFNDGHTLLMDLESQINVKSPYKQHALAISSASTVVDDSTDDEMSSYSVKNSFQVKFDNGDKIEFFCDSTYERERWLDVLKVILGRIPTLPTWLSV